MADPGPMRPADMVFQLRRPSIQHDKCVFCGGDAKDFKDELSAKEYRISGLCQKCQDETF
jgi:hypothetical protein